MKKRILLLTAFAALSLPLHAQQGGGGMGRMMGSAQMGTMSSLMLLTRVDVQEELKLDTSQTAKVDALKAGATTQFQTLMMSLRGVDPSERAAKFSSMIDSLGKEWLDVLNDDQKKRLKELTIQSAGALVVLKPDVAKDLGITEGQKAKIDDLQRLQREANNGLRDRMQDGDIDQDEFSSRLEKNRQTLDAAVIKLLNEGQRTKLKALGGKPFEFKDPKPGTTGFMTRPGG